MLCVIGSVATISAAPPNILFFLVDDLGYGDLGCTGSTLAETRNIDQFREQSMLFSNAYTSAAHCSPSRGAILTGQYPARFHITTWIGGNKPETYENLRLPKQSQALSEDAYTVAEYFKELGYATAQIGKWHLGSSEVPIDKHGFDYVIGHAPGASPGPVEAWYGPYPKIKDLSGPKGEYITDRLTDETLRFLESHEEGMPFFIMLQHYDVHGPLTAPSSDTKKYLDQGIHLNRRKENATYLAMKENIDESLGRIIEKLKELEIYDNTIIVFFSDNGGVHHSARNLPLSRGKKWPHEGGIRVPLIMRVPGMTEAGSTCDVPVNGIDFFPTLVELAGGDSGQIPSVQDGVSVVSLLKGAPSLERDAMYWHHPHVGKTGKDLIAPHGVVRQGPWKLIHYYGETMPAELYNLDKDIAENKNRANKYPEKVIQMRELLEKHLDSVGAQQVELMK